MKIDGNFVKGVAYYIGDGRMTAPRSLSTVNQDIGVIKFFIKWLNKYFNIKTKNMKIRIKVSSPYYKKNKVLSEYAQKLDIRKEFISSVSLKPKSKPNHKTIVEIWANNVKAKRIFNNTIPLVKNKCLNNKKLAVEYIKGIMAAEGSPKYNLKSGSRSIHLKMKNENEIKYIGKLLNEVIKITSSVLKLKEDGMWLITISGFYELNELNKLNIFEIEDRKRKKLRKTIESYKRVQVKKGYVTNFYLGELKKFNKKLNKNLTAPELARLIGRDRTRTINVLRELEKKNLIKSQRRNTTGRPFEFWE